MASSSRMRQTVVRPIGLPSSCAARLARSVLDWRLNGLPVRATTSQAMEAIIALSRGGKDGLAASSGSVFKGKIAFTPASPPEADGVRVKVEASSGRRVGKRGALLEQQDQVGALAEMGRRRARQEE